MEINLKCFKFNCTGNRSTETQKHLAKVLFLNLELQSWIRMRESWKPVHFRFLKVSDFVIKWAGKYRLFQTQFISEEFINLYLIFPNLLDMLNSSRRFRRSKNGVYLHHKRLPKYKILFYRKKKCQTRALALCSLFLMAMNHSFKRNKLYVSYFASG